MYPFPSSAPIDSEIAMQALQDFLLSEAEKKLGCKNPNKSIAPPSFENRGPYILNSQDRKSAWAVLSYKTYHDWPMALYELAHETVHLLDPIVGPSNYLEEGIAVAFSIDMAKQYANMDKQPENQKYLTALTLVKCLPKDCYIAAKSIRKRCGSLSKATPSDLALLLPDLDLNTINQLCQKFDY